MEKKLLFKVSERFMTKIRVVIAQKGNSVVIDLFVAKATNHSSLTIWNLVVKAGGVHDLQVTTS